MRAVAGTPEDADSVPEQRCDRRRYWQLQVTFS
jgi:hypothetical protein